MSDLTQANEMYTGTLIQGKTGTPNYKIKRRTKKAEEKWTKVDGAVGEIIPKKDFELVQDLLLMDTRIPPDGESLYPFSGTLFCADCGAPMVRKTVSSRGRKYIYYVCSYNKHDKACCSPHRIPENVLETAALQAVTEHINRVLALEEASSIMELAPRTAADVKKYEERILRKTEEVEKIKKRKLRLYEDLKDGILSREEYGQLREQYGLQIMRGEEELRGFRESLQDAMDNKTDQHLWIEEFKKHKGIERLSRSDVVHMVERIDVLNAKSIEVHFRFMEEYEALAGRIKGVRAGMAKEAI